MPECPYCGGNHYEVTKETPRIRVSQCSDCGYKVVEEKPQSS